MNIRGRIVVVLMLVGMVVFGLPVGSEAIAPASGLTKRAELALTLADYRSSFPAVDDAARVHLWALEHAPSEFAGVWYKTPGSPGLVAGFTTDAPDYSSKLANVVADPAQLEIVRVERSWNDLVALQARVDADKLALRASGVEITGTAIRSNTNRVSIAVRDLDADTRQRLEARYREDQITVLQRDYVRPTHRWFAPPFPAGMHLFGDCAGYDCLLAACTGAFITFEWIQGVRFYHMLTAGHCFEWLSQVTTHNGVPVGTVTNRHWYHGTVADAERITISGPNDWPYVITTDPVEEVVTSMQAFQTIGASVCKAGVTTEETCGWSVIEIHASYDVCTDPTCTTFITIFDHVGASRTSPGVNYGDSGGPVYNRSSGIRAHGIVSAMDASRTFMVYADIANSLNATGTNLCMQAVC